MKLEPGSDGGAALYSVWMKHGHRGYFPTHPPPYLPPHFILSSRFLSPIPPSQHYKPLKSDFPQPSESDLQSVMWLTFWTKAFQKEKENGRGGGGGGWKENIIHYGWLILHLKWMFKQTWLAFSTHFFSFFPLRGWEDGRTSFIIELYWLLSLIGQGQDMSQSWMGKFNEDWVGLGWFKLAFLMQKSLFWMHQINSEYSLV